MAILKESTLAQGKARTIVSHIPTLEAATKACILNVRALCPHWVQWASLLSAVDVKFEYDLTLRMQEFLKYTRTYHRLLKHYPLRLISVFFTQTVLYSLRLALNKYIQRLVLHCRAFAKMVNSCRYTLTLEC